MSITLEKKQCLIAGNGELPIRMAESAKKNGCDVIAISLSSDNRKGLEKICTRLCECFNREEGYVTNLNLNDKSWDVPCITLKINIED